MCVCMYLSLPKDMTIDFRERRREGEKHRCEKETSVGCLLYMPQLGTKPTT